MDTKHINNYCLMFLFYYFLDFMLKKVIFTVTIYNVHNFKLCEEGVCPECHLVMRGGKWIAAHPLHRDNTHRLKGHNTRVRPGHPPAHTQSSSTLFAYLSRKIVMTGSSQHKNVKQVIHDHSLPISFFYYSMFSHLLTFEDK
jgi:hypothetical protein